LIYQSILTIYIESSKVEIMKQGLENIIAATTRLSSVDGEAGKLILAGYPVEDLASNATFEEVAYLFLMGELPYSAELETFSRRLSAHRELPAIAIEVLRQAASCKTPAMDALQMAVPLLSLPRSDDPFELALTAIAALPTIVGTYARLLNGLDPVPPQHDLSHAAHYLHQLTGEIPAPERTRALETYLNTVCDHGFNASTFTARVIASTGSDVISAVTGAVGALKGSLHGGAPGPALDMVFEIGKAERAEPYLREKLSRGERLMGFGHRVYRVRDPRADVLAHAAAHFYQTEADRNLYELARSVEATALRLLREQKPERRIETNVEFYTALLLHGLGLPTEFFTPTFAVGRVLGWSAHYLEQIREGRLIRPQSQYIGNVGLQYDKTRLNAMFSPASR
jgi:citrate synthase